MPFLLLWEIEKTPYVFKTRERGNATMTISRAKRGKMRKSASMCPLRLINDRAFSAALVQTDADDSNCGGRQMRLIGMSVAHAS